MYYRAVTEDPPTWIVFRRAAVSTGRTDRSYFHRAGIQRATWVAGFHQINNYRCVPIIVYHYLMPVYRFHRNNIPLTNGPFIAVYLIRAASPVALKSPVSARSLKYLPRAPRAASSYLLLARVRFVLLDLLHSPCN